MLTTQERHILGVFCGLIFFMDTITPSLSNSTPTSKRYISYSIVAFVLLAAILGGTFWYANQDKQVGPPFDPARQFVPENTESLNVSKVLAAFGFNKPLPFFDERNVVQSLNLQSTATSSAPQAGSSSFLSYRIFGQSKEATQSALVEYFKNLGWTMQNIHKVHASGDNKIEIVDFFSSEYQNQIISVTLFEMPRASGNDQPFILVAIKTKNTILLNR